MCVFFCWYTSELIRNQTLRFLSKTLPVLKADDTLPKVTQVQQDDLPDGFDGDYGGGNNRVDRRMSRSYKDAAAAVIAADELPVMLASKQRSVGNGHGELGKSTTNGGPKMAAARPVRDADAPADGGAANAEGRVPRKFCDNGGV